MVKSDKKNKREYERKKKNDEPRNPEKETRRKQADEPKHHSDNKPSGVEDWRRIYGFQNVQFGENNCNVNFFYRLSFNLFPHWS